MRSLILSALAITLFAIASNAKEELIVKYSTHDCLFCNMQLISMQKIKGDINKSIIIKEEYRDDESLADTKTRATDLGFKIKYSDSLYYSIDSTERSMVYLIGGGHLLYSGYLKTIEIDKINELVKGEEEKGHINFPKLILTRQNEQYIYISGDYKYILQISKKSLNQVYDTIYVFTPTLKTELFKAHYANNYKSHLDSFLSLTKENSLPNTFRITDIQADDDSLWVLCYTNTIERIDTNYRMVNLPFLLLYLGNSLKKIISLDYITPLKNKDEVYNVSTSSFFKDNSDFYLAVRKDDLNNKNGLFTKGILKGNILTPGTLLPYYMADYISVSKTGYMLADKVYSNGMLNNAYSDEFYDLHENKTIKLNIDHNENNFKSSAVTNLRFKTNFKIETFNYDSGKLQVVYKSMDSLLLARFIRKGDKVTQTSRSVLSTSYPNKEKFANGIVCDNEGIYSYSYADNRFYYYRYKDLK